MKDKRNWSESITDRKMYAQEHGGFYFGTKSWNRLKTCHPKIQEVMIELIKWYNFSVNCGERDRDKQDDAVRSGTSRVQYPDSIHNPDNPVNKDGKGVRAIDILPYPKLDWEDDIRFAYMAGMVMLVARQKGIPMRWGRDWNRDGRMIDEKRRKALLDYPHFEYKEGQVVI